MKLYHRLTEAVFGKRLHRFAADVALGGQMHTVHVKNTGRLGELLLPGARVWLEASDNPARKTRYDLVCVENRGYVVNIDSQAPNRIFREFAEAGGWLPEIAKLRSEVTRGDSRFDFAYTHHAIPGFVEVKGVTLFDDEGCAFFPDAPTERGVKHLHGLIQARQEGCESGVCFILQRDGVTGFRPHDLRHPAFGQALREAAAAGVVIRAVGCHVTPDSCGACYEVPVIL